MTLTTSAAQAKFRQYDRKLADTETQMRALNAAQTRLEEQVAGMIAAGVPAAIIAPFNAEVARLTNAQVSLASTTADLQLHLGLVEARVASHNEQLEGHDERLMTLESDQINWFAIIAIGVVAAAITLVVVSLIIRPESLPLVAEIGVAVVIGAVITFVLSMQKVYSHLPYMTRKSKSVPPAPDNPEDEPAVAEAPAGASSPFAPPPTLPTATTPAATPVASRP